MNRYLLGYNYPERYFLLGGVYLKFKIKIGGYDQIKRGKEYKPAIIIQDVPSLGRSTRIHGIKTGRQHEFLSDMERNYFHILNFSDFVIDFREQFSLQLNNTGG